LIEAFNKVSNKNVELRIYGIYNPNSIYFRELKTRIKNTNIKFMGRFEDVKEPYSEIDVLVVPSLCYETGGPMGPMVIREALATKTPVIASRVGSVSELSIDNVNGLLFEAKNPRDLLKKIMKIVKDQELIDKFKANIKPIKSIEEQAGEIEIIYKSLVNL